VRRNAVCRHGASVPVARPSLQAEVTTRTTRNYQRTFKEPPPADDTVLNK